VRSAVEQIHPQHRERKVRSGNVDDSVEGDTVCRVGCKAESGQHEEMERKKERTYSGPKDE
jgi:hypothetical protein